jgi:hypothetical protein
MIFFIDSPASRCPFENAQFSDEDDDFQDEEMKRARLLRTTLRGELSSFMNLRNHTADEHKHFQMDTLGLGVRKACHTN